MPPRFPRSLDPHVLFVILATAALGLHALTRSEPEPDTSRLVVVTDADVAVMFEGFRRTRLRPPTVQELRAILDRHVRDEILYREAVGLGLDREDPALRRRLATKLEYLAKDVGAAVEPTEAELETYYDAHAERYALQPRRAFRHVFFSEDKRGERAVADARDLTARLQKTPQASVEEEGDPILLEPEVPPATREMVARDFGNDFAAALFEAEPERWVGPIASSYGLHVVRVDAVDPGIMPPLAEVRDRVRTDLLVVKKEAALESYLESLYEKYDIVIRAELPEPAPR